MAVTATYKTSAVEYKDAYIRIERIWGSKSEGWNAWVGVYENKGDKSYKELFSVNTAYVDGENPFSALYKVVEGLSFIVMPGQEQPIPVPAVATEVGISPPEYVPPVEETKEEEVVEEVKVVKKTRSKKK